MRLLKYLRVIVISVIGILLVYLILGLTLSVLSTDPTGLDCEKNYEVYLVSNGIHLDIVISIDELSQKIFNELGVLGQTKFVAFGWGDKQFYLETPTWDDLSLIVAIKALLLRGPTAMHVTFYSGLPNAATSVALCESQHAQLTDYIYQSFKQDSSGHFMEIEGAGYTDHDRFYEATGDLSFIKTCNEWVNSGLKQAKVKTAIWSPFDYGVLLHL